MSFIKKKPFLELLETPGVTWAYPGESKGCFTGHFRPFRGHLNSASIWKLRLDPNNNGRPCQIGSSPSMANIRNQTCEIQLRFAN